MTTQIPTRPAPAATTSRPTGPATSASPPRLFIPADRRRMTPAMKAGLLVGALAVVVMGAVVAYRLAAGPGGGTPSAPPTVADPLASAGSNRPEPTSTPVVDRQAPARQPASFEMGKTLDPSPAHSGSVPAVAPGTREPSRPDSVPRSDQPSGPGVGGDPTPTDAAPPAPAPPPAPVKTEAQILVEQASKAQSAGNLVEAQALLNRALLDGRVPDNERGAIRAQLASLADSIVFSPTLARGDRGADIYTVASGDNLVTIRAKLSLPVDWRLIQRINRANPSTLRIGQKLKVITMPFHAVVVKSAFRLDLYMGDPVMGTSAASGPDGQDPSWVFVRSFPVGLGEVGAGNLGTPEGVFTVRPKSKLINPHWVNPRTGEKFAADDPLNPIGEHWIGLEGVDASGKPLAGYGIHGTIDPDSIGKQKSMGCVRMRADDVALLYEVLVDRISTVRIVR